MHQSKGDSSKYVLFYIYVLAKAESCGLSRRMSPVEREQKPENPLELAIY